MVYVRIHSQVDNPFVFSKPHVIKDIYEIALVKDCSMSEWKIIKLFVLQSKFREVEICHKIE